MPGGLPGLFPGQGGMPMAGLPQAPGSAPPPGAMGPPPGMGGGMDPALLAAVSRKLAGSGPPGMSAGPRPSAPKANRARPTGGGIKGGGRRGPVPKSPGPM